MNALVVIILVLIWFFVMGELGRWVAGQKGRSRPEGAGLALLLGPLGLLIEVLLPTLKEEGRR